MSDWRECTEGKYNYGLECLPPRLWEMSKGFLVGEPMDHGPDGATYSAFIRYQDKFYAGPALTTSQFRALKPHEVAAEADKLMSVDDAFTLVCELAEQNILPWSADEGLQNQRNQQIDAHEIVQEYYANQKREAARQK